MSSLPGYKPRRRRAEDCPWAVPTDRALGSLSSPHLVPQPCFPVFHPMSSAAILPGCPIPALPRNLMAILNSFNWKSEGNVAVFHKEQEDALTVLLFNWSASTKPKVGELQRSSHTSTNSSNSFLPPTEGKGPRNHRAMGWFVLEENSKTHPASLRQGHLHSIRLPGCHLVWLWAPQGMGQLQLLWAIFFSAPPCSQ